MTGCRREIRETHACIAKRLTAEIRTSRESHEGSELKVVHSLSNGKLVRRPQSPCRTLVRHEQKFFHTPKFRGFENLCSREQQYAPDPDMRGEPAITWA